MKLHIGGVEVKAGWKILNAKRRDGVDFVGDISDLSQFDDNQFDEIYASHVLEHVSHSKVIDTLLGIKRVLKEGGKFYVSVPDLDIICHAFINPLFDVNSKYNLMTMMYGGQVDEFDFHYVGFNYQFLIYFLNKAGFRSAKRVSTFGIFKDTSEYMPFGFPISLNVVAEK